MSIIMKKYPLIIYRNVPTRVHRPGFTPWQRLGVHEMRSSDNYSETLGAPCHRFLAQTIHC